MEIRHIADDVGYVEDSVRNVWVNLALGALFATFVMFLFLKSVRVTAIAVMGIPLCTIASFLGLLATGRTVNVISLAGVAFAIGMTLDNSIVVIESIALERRRGLDRLQAAIAGVQKVWSAVLASTLTTILVFTPVLFIEEEAGQLYSDVAIAISASIFASMLVAITLLPTASANRGFDGEFVRASRSADTQQWQLMSGALLRWVRWLLATARRRIITIVTVAIAGLLAIVALTPPGRISSRGGGAKTVRSHERAARLQPGDNERDWPRGPR